MLTCVWVELQVAFLNSEQQTGRLEWKSQWRGMIFCFCWSHCSSAPSQDILSWLSCQKTICMLAGVWVELQVAFLNSEQQTGRLEWKSQRRGMIFCFCWSHCSIAPSQDILS